MSRIIWQLTAAHAPVNYVLIDYGSYVPDLPAKLYNDSRVEPGKFSYLNLPNRLTSAVSDFLKLLFRTLTYGCELLKSVSLINEKTHISFKKLVKKHINNIL